MGGSEMYIIHRNGKIVLQHQIDIVHGMKG